MCLESALKMVQSYGNSVTLSVSTDASVKPVGLLQAVGHLSEEGQGAFTNPIDFDCKLMDLDSVASTLRVLLVAAVRSGCHVERLRITAGKSFNHDDKNISPWDMNAPFANAVEELHSGVRVLHIDLLRGKFVHQLSQTLNVTLGRMDNLVELQIRTADDVDACYYQDNMPAFVQMFRSVRSHCLYAVDLEEVLCTQEGIIPLLKNNRDTLKRLRLVNVLLQGSWEEIMLWVRDHCSLTFLEAANLAELDENFFVPGGEYWADDNGFGGRNEAEVLSSLDNFLEKKRREQDKSDEED